MQPHDSGAPEAQEGGSHIVRPGPLSAPDSNSVVGTEVRTVDVVAVARESNAGPKDVLSAFQVALRRLSSLLAASSATPMRSCAAFKRSCGVAFA
jgi:hypothetical protein